MGCSLSMYEPPGCTLSSIGCQRRDSTPVVEFGVHTRVDSDPVVCEHCPPCCENSPCGCQGVPQYRVCDSAVIEGEDAWSYTPASCLGSDAATIGATLRAAAWCADDPFVQCCDALSGLCLTTKTIAFLYAWFGTKATMDHEWRMVRVFTGESCGLPGTHITPCGNATSGIVADVVDRASSGCEDVTDPCGPACP